MGEKITPFVSHEELDELKEIVDLQIPQTIGMMTDSFCPNCGKPVADTSYSFCPHCSQSLNWVGVPNNRTSLAKCIRIKKPSDVFDMIEAQGISAPTINKLISHFGSFHAIFEASPEELCHVEGVSEKTALQIASLIPVYQMYEQDKYAKKLQVNHYKDVVAYCRTLFAGANNEMCYLLCFDAQLHLIAMELVNRGTPTEVNVHPRMILEIAIKRFPTADKSAFPLRDILG